LSADHSCRAVVARLVAYCLVQRQSPCSAETGAYCQARQHLPESFFADVARHTVRALEAQVDPHWLWKRRRVYINDWSSVSMPDAAKNQAEYPQPYTQKPGLGVPLARIVAIFSLACGAVLDVGICRYAGKGQSELGLLRTLWDLFRQGDVLLADRLTYAWSEMVMLQQRGVDCVCRLTSHRTADFRRGQRLGSGDHLVRWAKPGKPRSIDRKTDGALPEFLKVRECHSPGGTVGLSGAEPPHHHVLAGRGHVYQRRPRNALSGPLASLARSAVAQRNAPDERVQLQDFGIGTEGTLDAGSGLQPDAHRNSPSRQQTREGAAPHRLQGAVQTLEAFRPVLALMGEADADSRKILSEQLLDAIDSHRVADHPDRYEPRLHKRRPKHYGVLRKPRPLAKSDLVTGVKEK
jgi:hypothetical protein